MSKFKEIKFLGNGEPMTTMQFNTCFAFVDENKEYFLIDTGGGNGILKRFKDENIDIKQIKNIFITHSHTDHILGALWIIRKIANIKEEYNCNFYMSESVYKDLINLCNICISKHMEKAQKHITFKIVSHLQKVKIGDNIITFFDTFTQKTPQLACKIENGEKTIGFCGDIPLERDNFSLLNNIDILMHEALCDSKSAEKFNVYNRGHVTSKDAARTAKETNSKKLVLIHKADAYIRNNILKDDAKTEFDGEIEIPEDGTIIKLN